MSSDNQFNTAWRKVASTIYKKPSDSKILGGVEFDVTDLEIYIALRRKAGLKITMTHFFVLALAMALKTEVPEFNTWVRRGKIIARETISAAVSVLKADGGMTSIIVPDVDRLDFEELEAYMNSEITKSRGGNESDTMQSKNILARIPWPFRKWFFSIYKLFVLNLGISIPGLGMKPDNSGSYLVTNIGSIGLDHGYPALLPTANFSFVFVMGGVQKKPVVVDESIVIRRMMTVTIAIDHRVADASHGARLFRYLKRVVKNPEIFD